jgi:hypothetical protein
MLGTLRRRRAPYDAPASQLADNQDFVRVRDDDAAGWFGRYAPTRLTAQPAQDDSAGVLMRMAM